MEEAGYERHQMLTCQRVKPLVGPFVAMIPAGIIATKSATDRQRVKELNPREHDATCPVYGTGDYIPERVNNSDVTIHRENQYPCNGGICDKALSHDQHFVTTRRDELQKPSGDSGHVIAYAATR